MAAASSTGAVEPSAPRTPAVVPAIVSLLAPSRAARCPASVSAFTFNNRPSRPMPIDAITGTNPSPTSVVSSVVSDPAARNADAAQIHGAAVDGAMGRRRLRKPARGVGAGQSDRPDARRGQRRDKSCVDGAGQHRHDDVQRRVVGDPKAVDLPLLDAGRFERRVDLLAAAMDDDQRHALLRRAGDGRDDRRQPRPIFEQLAAELQDDGPSTSVFFTTGHKGHKGRKAKLKFSWCPLCPPWLTRAPS